MKRKSIYVGLVMAVAALLCLAGCKKDEGEKVVLGTQFEKSVSAQKTYLGENNTVCWNEGDKVKVNGTECEVSAEGVAVAENENGYAAVYPATEGNTLTYNGDVCGKNCTGGTVVIPAVQTYRVESDKQVLDGPMAARLNASSGILYFKNLYSLLKVTVSADDKAFTVNSITVTATGDNAKALAGTYGFSFGEQSTTEAAPTVNPYANEDKDSSKSVKLTGINSTVAVNNDADFYLVAHPMTSQNLTVKVKGVLDGKMVVYTYHTASARSLNRNSIGGLGINLQQLNPVLRGIGEFTVNSEGKQVEFSPGNLQWSAAGGTAAGTWRFAEHQYDYIGDANKNIAQNYTDWIDLFGWGTSGYQNKYPYMTSQTSTNYGNGESDIAGTNYDWGVYNAIYNPKTKSTDAAGTWRTLSNDEWVYLIQIRTKASDLCKYGVTVCGKSNCLIIAPDGFTGTIDASYDASAWSAAEAAGLVCLPAAGYRGGTSVNDAGSCGYYWSSTYNSSIYAYYLNFRSGGVYPSNGYYSRYFGRSVRLVKDVE